MTARDARSHPCAGPGCRRHVTGAALCEPCTNRLPLPLRVAIGRARESARAGAADGWARYSSTVGTARAWLRAQTAQHPRTTERTEP